MPPTNRESTECVLVPKRVLADLLSLALQLRKEVDNVSRSRIDVTSTCNRLEEILGEVSPGLVAHVKLLEGG